MARKGIIELENMEFQSFHGCFEAERTVGNRFLVYMYIETDVEQPSRSDDVRDTINYLSVYETVREQMEQPSRILEHVCRRILDAVAARFPRIAYARVKVSKMAPPLGGNLERVSVSLDYKNHDYQ